MIVVVGEPWTHSALRGSYPSARDWPRHAPQERDSCSLRYSLLQIVDYAQNIVMNTTISLVQAFLLDDENDTPAPPGSPPTRKHRT